MLVGWLVSAGISGRVNVPGVVGRLGPRSWLCTSSACADVCWAWPGASSQVEEGENTHFTSCFHTCSLSGFRKEMLKQDVFKDAFAQISVFLRKLFKYLIALNTDISGLDFQPYFCLALVSNHQTSVASFR